MLLCRLFALRPISLNNFVLDESNTDNQKIWAVDPNIFGTKTQKNVKETKYMTLSNQNAAVLRPVYILQPERITNEQGRGYKRYDRGRSFSPPKERSSVALSRPNVTFAPNNGTFCGSAPNSISHHASSTSKYLSKPQENFKKSFSTNTLYYNATENASFSSRSSTTSTEGSLNKSGNWHNKDFKSGIPIPVSNCEKFKIRTTANVGSSSVGPVVARRNAFGSPIETTPVLVRSNTSEHTLNLPPRSSESESSGYFTPPESQRAFVKLDTEERTSETEEIANNNHVDCVNSYSNSTNSIFPAVETTSIKRVFSASSSDDPDVHKYSQESIVENNNSRPHSRFSQGNELENISMSADIKNKNKSKSVVELQSNFLPEINNVRKLSSAPPTNNETSLNNLNNNFDETPITPLKTTVTVLPGSMELVEENIEQSVETNESVTTVRLTRRFQRSQSKKSFKSTPKSTKESPVATLRPFSKPKEALHHILSQMESNEWETIIQGLQGLMRVSRNHPETIENQMHNVCVTLSKHIKNLRSQVARVACKTAGELFESCNKKGLLEMEFEEIAAPLLQRTADTNKFLRADANAALDRMSEHMPNIRVVAVVTSRGCCHQNAIVRAASIRILSEMVKRHGPDKIFQLPIETRNKILVAGANALADGSQEARGHGKSMFALLKTQPGFHRALLEAVPQNILRHISKSLNSIKAGG